MIFKLQKAFNAGKVLIYDEGRTYQGEVPLSPELDELFAGRYKLYAHGYIKDGQAYLDEEAESQPW